MNIIKCLKLINIPLNIIAKLHAIHIRNQAKRNELNHLANTNICDGETDILREIDRRKQTDREPCRSMNLHCANP